MGRDKGLIPLAGRPLIAHVLANVTGLGDEIIITTNNPAGYAHFGYRTATDEVPGAGALPGLKTALTAAQGDTVLLVACDMPFLNRSLLVYLLDLAPEGDVVVPLWDERHQTMHAVYRRDRCLAAVEDALARGDRRMISFYPALTVRTVTPAEISRYDPAGRSFMNINTPQELAAAEALITA